MISNFSSLVEFMAAVYITMCVDNELCNKFWTKKLTLEIEEEINKYSFAKNQPFYRSLQSEIFNKQSRIILFSRKKGAYMLSLSLMFLCLFGFESGLDNKTLLYRQSLTVVLILSILIFLFYRLLFCKWKYVFFSSLFVIGTFLYLINETPDWLNISFLANVLKYNQFIFCALIVVPAVYQLLENWLFSNIYKGYLKEAIKKEYDLFSVSYKGIKDRTPNRVNKVYNKAWTDDIMISRNFDTSLNCLYDLFQKRLLGIVNPNSLLIILSLVKYYWKRLETYFTKQNIAVIPEYSLSHYEDAINYETQYNDFLSLKSKNKNLSIRQYCQDKKINAKEMIAWLKVKKPNKHKNI